MENVLTGKTKRLTIYIGETDQWRNKPLYMALLETLKANGLAGATVTRGVAGFGARSRIHTAAILRLSEDLPLVIEVIDSQDKIDSVLETIYPMVREGLITLEDVQVLKYTHRGLNPLPADRPVSTIMSGKVVSLNADQSIHQAWQTMLQHKIKALPVVDETNSVVGMLTDEDLMKRAGVQQRLSVARRIDQALIREELNRLSESTLTVGDVMTTPVITAQDDAPLSSAVNQMKKQSLKRLPVVDAKGKLVGILSRFDILQQILPVPVQEQHEVLLHPTAHKLADIMSSRIPQVGEDEQLPGIIQKLLDEHSHRLIVVDAQDRVSGILSDADVVANFRDREKTGILSALQKRGNVPASRKTAKELMSPEPLSAGPETSIVAAIQLMMKAGRKWLVVVDEHRHPLGLVDRQILLESLADLPAST